jgi:hypothetical protein
VYPSDKIRGENVSGSFSAVKIFMAFQQKTTTIIISKNEIKL